MQMKGEKTTDYAVIKQLPWTQEPLCTQCWWLPYCGHNLTYIFAFTLQHKIAFSQILLIQGVNEYWMLHIREYFPIQSVNFYSISEKYFHNINKQSFTFSGKYIICWQQNIQQFAMEAYKSDEFKDSI